MNTVLLMVKTNDGFSLIPDTTGRTHDKGKKNKEPHSLSSTSNLIKNQDSGLRLQCYLRKRIKRSNFKQIDVSKPSIYFMTNILF